MKKLHQTGRRIASVSLGALLAVGVLSSAVGATSPSFPAVAVATNPGTIVSPVVVKNITVGSSPYGVSSDGTDVFVANSSGNSVSEIATATGTVAGTTTLTGSSTTPEGVSDDGTHVWIAETVGNKVVEYTTSGTLVQSFAVTDPVGVSSDGTNVWVTSESTNTLIKISIASSTLSSIALGSGTAPQGVSSDGANVWVADSGANEVSQVNASTGSVTRTIAVSTTPVGVSSDGTDAWVTNSGAGTVSEIATSTGTVVGGPISVGSSPQGISSDATDVWVANSGAGTVSEIAASSGIVVATLTVGSNPTGVSADGSQVWVSNKGSGTVSEITSALSITTPSLNNASTNSSYSQTIAATGGYGAYTWSATGLPTGLSINSTTGVISGSNPPAGDYVVAVTVTDPIGQSATLDSSIYASTFPTIDVPNYPGNIPNPEVAANTSTFYEGADANAISVDGNDAWYANLIGYNSGSAPGGSCSQNNGCGSVTEVNLTTGAIVQTLLGGPSSQPSGFPTITACQTATGGTCSASGQFTYPAAIYSDGTYVWIPSFAASTLSQYDIATSSFVGTPIATGSLPSGVYSDGTDVWVANALGNSVTEVAISPTQSTVVRTISGLGSVRGITGDGQYVFVTDSGGMAVIDKATGSVVATPTTSQSSGSYGISADGNHVWETNQSNNSVFEFDETGIGYTPANTAANATSNWAVSLTASPTGAVSSGGTVTVTFPDNVIIPATPTVTFGSGFTGGASCSSTTASTTGESVTVTLPSGCSLAANTAATFTVDGITNPNATTTGQSAFGVISDLTNTNMYHPGSISADGTDVWVGNDGNQSSGSVARTPTVTEFNSSTGAYVGDFTGLGGTSTGTTQVVGGVGSTGKDVWVAVGENDSAAANSQTVEIKPSPELTNVALNEVNSNTCPSTPASQTITATGGQAPFTYSATGLPGTLSINSTTGVITGCATADGNTPASVTITATDARGNTASITDPLYVDPPPAITTPAVNAETPAGTLPEATTGTTYSAATIPSGGTGVYTFSATGLPAGLSINSSTGVISGTPTTPGTYPVVVTLTDTSGATATLSTPIVVATPPVITTTSLADAPLSTAYNHSVAGSGGTTPYTSFTATGLPPGLSMSTSGVITGTPTSTDSGTYPVSVTLTDHGGVTATKSLNITVPTQPTLPTTLPTPLTTTPYSASDAASGGVTPYASYAVTAGSLPAGLALNPSTGAITGTATTPGAYNFTVTVTDADGQTASQAYTGTIPGVPTLPATLPTPSTSTPYTGSAAASGGVTPYASYALTAGSLPPGLTLNTSTGAITGTATTVGPYSFTIKVTDADGQTATQAYSGSVPGVPTLPTTIAPPLLSTTYSGTVAASGGATPYASYAVTGGSLPAGLTLNTSTGVITGTPTTPGVYSVTVTVTDAIGQTATKTYTGNIPTTPVLPATLPTPLLAQPYTPSDAATGGVSPFVGYAITGGALPSGVSFNTTTGALSGTPNAAGPYSFTVTVTDGDGQTNTKTYSGTIPTLPALPTSLPVPLQNTPYSQSDAATNGVTPYAGYAVTAGTLPSGLSLNPTTGQISGTPSAPGPYNFTVTVTDADGQKSSQTYAGTIPNLPDITTTSLPVATPGEPYSATLASSGGTSPITYAITAGVLPTNLTLDPSTGNITGEPNAEPGTYPITVTATDAKGETTSKSLFVVIGTPPVITTSTLPTAISGFPYNQTLQGTGQAPLTWSATGLPPGLSINASSGAITGTSSVPGTYHVTVTITSSQGTVATKQLTIVIGNPGNQLPDNLRDVINFGENSSVLTPPMLAQIQKIANFMKAHPADRSLLLTGYTDPLSSSAYNYALGQRRSNNVMAKLQHDLTLLHVTNEVILTASGGATHLLSPSLKPPGRLKDRRVQVYLG